MRGKEFCETSDLLNWKDIVSIDVGAESISAIDASGNYYFAEFEHYSDKPRCAIFSPDGYVRGGLELFRYYPDGTVCKTDNATRTWNP